MATPNLTDADRAELARLLRRSIDADRYPLSPRVQRWKALLAKLDPAPAAAEPHPRPRHGSTAASGSGSGDADLARGRSVPRNSRAEMIRPAKVAGEDESRPYRVLVGVVEGLTVLGKVEGCVLDEPLRLDAAPF